MPQPRIFISLFIIAILGLTIGIIKKSGLMVTYQVSPSMPKGFYLVEPINIIKKGDIVLFHPPYYVLSFLLKQRWIPRSGLMMKYVMGIPGDKVCKKNEFIWINNKKIAKVYRFYAPGKLLLNKKFCGTLQQEEFLLMSTKVKKSFDGRYFGPINSKYIIGKATKL